MKTSQKAIVIIPIYHPDEKFIELLKMLHKQKDVLFDVYIIDSGSKREMYESYLQALSYKIVSISPSSFNHGGTRQQAWEACTSYPFLIYMTQDAIPADEYAIKRLLNIFADPAVGCGYGRQLPHRDASVLAARARAFNYPDKSQVKSKKDAPQLGIKVSFISDTFAAYRREALEAVGGFPRRVILGEDTYVASKMILAGWKVAYCAEAQVYHSHNYTIMQEFRRYFDTGVFHSQEPWIRQAFGEAEGEGKKFVLDELRYLFKHKPWMIPGTIIRDGMKFLGYRLGMKEKAIPASMKKKMSMTNGFWKNEL